MNGGDLAGAGPHVRVALDLANQLEDPSLAARALILSSNLDGYTGGGKEHDLLALAERELGGTDSLLEEVTAIHLAALDRLDEARDRFLPLLHEVTERGDEPVAGLIYSWLGDLEIRAGNWDLAIRHDAMARSEAGGIGSQPWVEYFVRLQRGEGRAVRTAVLDSLDAVERSGHIIDRLAIRRVMGSLEMRIGDLAEAWRHLGGTWTARGDRRQGPGLALFVPDGPRR
jgi:hypothetical protein